jgi:DNA sulfur modification protein DndC
LTPEVTDSFWVNMIGRGYPAPHSKFRWCTERMKIKPADKFILSKVAKHGEVVLILGQRRAESATRAQASIASICARQPLLATRTIARSF